MHRREQIFPEEGSESRRLVKGGAGSGGYVIPEQSAERFPCKRDRGRPLQRLALFDAVSGPVFPDNQSGTAEVESIAPLSLFLVNVRQWRFFHYNDRRKSYCY